MKRVLISTISYDGNVTSWFVDSLVNTLKKCVIKNIELDIVYISYDSLVQRAKNSAFRIAIEGKYDYLFMINRDLEWKPDVIFELLDKDKDIIALPVVEKKIDEKYNVVLDKNQMDIQEDGLVEVDSVSSSFMMFSRFALQKLWNISSGYKSEDKWEKMIFETRLKNGEIVSDDYIISEKWKNLGFKLWLYPHGTIDSVGELKYTGNFGDFLIKSGYN